MGPPLSSPPSLTAVTDRRHNDRRHCPSIEPIDVQLGGRELVTEEPQELAHANNDRTARVVMLFAKTARAAATGWQWHFQNGTGAAATGRQWHFQNAAWGNPCPCFAKPKSQTGCVQTGEPEISRNSPSYVSTMYFSAKLASPLTG